LVFYSIYTKHQQPTRWVNDDDGYVMFLSLLCRKNNGNSLTTQIFYSTESKTIIQILL
jgi:hypothetical protein